MCPRESQSYRAIIRRCPMYKYTIASAAGAFMCFVMRVHKYVVELEFFPQFSCTVRIFEKIIFINGSMRCRFPRGRWQIPLDPLAYCVREIFLSLAAGRYLIIIRLVIVAVVGGGDGGRGTM